MEPLSHKELRALGRAVEELLQRIVSMMGEAEPGV